MDGRRKIGKALPALLRQPFATPLTLMQKVRTMSGYRVEVLAEERPDWFAADLNHLLGMLAAGSIDPIIDATYSLDQAAEAHTHLGSANLTGKLVLTIS